MNITMPLWALCCAIPIVASAALVLYAMCVAASQGEKQP